MLELGRKRERRVALKPTLINQAVEAMREGNGEKLQCCIEEGFDVNRKLKIVLGEDQFLSAYPLSFVLEKTTKNLEDIVSILLEKGADLSKRVSSVKSNEEEGGTVSYQDDITYLQMAILRNEGKCIQLLVDSGVDVNASDNLYGTPIQYACLFECWEAVEVLIDNNVIHTCKCKSTEPLNSILFKLIVENKNDLILKLLAAGYMIRSDPLILSVRKNSKSNSTDCCDLQNFESTIDRQFLYSLLDRIQSPDTLLHLCRVAVRKRCRQGEFKNLDIDVFLKSYLALNNLWGNKDTIL